MGKIISFTVILALLISVSGCGFVVIGDGWDLRNYSGDWTDTYQFASGILTVAGVNGSITVEIWDQDEVRADARWTAKSETFQFTPEIGETEGNLSLTLPSDRDLTGVSWTIKVPKGLDIVVRTSNGRINLHGDGYGGVTINTSNGRVNLDATGDGTLYVNTSNGGVNLRSWTGDVDITTSNGSITARLGEVNAGRYSLTTSNGSIRVCLEDDSAFNLSASTSNGRIYSDLKGDWSREISGSSHDSLYNGGTARLILRTSNSHIYLDRP